MKNAFANLRSGIGIGKRLGDGWIYRPPVTELFCNQQDIEDGLRPYRLQTCYWRPDDQYKQEEAIALVAESRRRLLAYYESYRTEVLAWAERVRS